MSAYELTFSQAPKPKRNSKKINWTQDMIETIRNEFSTSFNRPLAKKLGVGMRTMIRKARELNLEKEEGFLDKRRAEITRMAIEAHPPHPHKGKKGWFVPNSEYTRFKPGQVSLMSIDRDVVEKVRTKRNETIARDRRRIRMGLDPLTKLKLKA